MLFCCGFGSCFGVTPSTSRCPSGHTITRSNVTFSLMPPLDSGIASVLGSWLKSFETCHRSLLAVKLRFPWAATTPKFKAYDTEFAMPQAAAPTAESALAPDHIDVTL